MLIHQDGTLRGNHARRVMDNQWIQRRHASVRNIRTDEYVHECTRKRTARATDADEPTRLNVMNDGMIFVKGVETVEQRQRLGYVALVWMILYRCQILYMNDIHGVDARMNLTERNPFVIALVKRIVVVIGVLFVQRVDASAPSRTNVEQLGHL